MKAGLRFGIAVFAGMGLGSAALAQDAAQSNTPATDAVGPKELQNFSLDGKPTRPAQTVPVTVAPPARKPAVTDQTAASATEPARAPQKRVAESKAQTPTVRPAQRELASAEPPAATAAASLSPGLPATTAPAQAVAEPGFAPEPTNLPANLTPEGGFDFWPWLLLAAVIGAGGALLLWRRRSREALAVDHEVDAYVAPEPVPAPTPEPPANAPSKPVVSKKFGPPAPATKPAPSKPVGVTSTKLRPWLEVTFKPLRCVVYQDRVALDFEVELLNSGATPARDVVVEACMLAAGATQEQELAAFFTKPSPKEDPIAVIAPLQKINLRSSLVATRESLRAVEVEGQQMLVPLMAFNAIYRAGSSEGRTSTSYLLGRSTKSEKIAPFPAEAAARAYSSLDTRQLPLGARN